MSFMLLINDGCFQALEKIDYKLSFGVIYASLKVFKLINPDDDQDLSKKLVTNFSD